MNDFVEKRYGSLKEILGDLSEILLPPERISVSDAAAKYRLVYNPPAYVGPWDNDMVPYNREVMETLESREFSAVCFAAPAQSAKALALDTPIATPKGWTTMGDLQSGDKIFDENGKVCTVIAATDTMVGKNCFRITFDDGSEIVCDEEHKWYVETKDLGSKVTNTLAMSKDFNFATQRANGRSRYAVPNTKALNLPDIELPVDPYVLGLWLGDGSTYRAHITCGDQDVEFCKAQIEKAGYRISCKREKTAWQIYIDPRVGKVDKTECTRGHNLDILGRTKRGYCAECARQQSKAHQYGFVVDEVLENESSLSAILLEQNLICNKHIPLAYLRAGYNQRLALLQGLMDSDGTASNRVSYSSFTTTLPALRDGMSELLSTFGIKHSVKKQQPSVNGVKGKIAWKISFTVYADDIEVFRLPRKLERTVPKGKTRPGQTTRRWIRNIESIDSVPVKCIAVDSPNHLYLAGKQMIPTHNTEVILNWLAYNITCDPSDFMLVEKSQTEARNFSMMKIDRMLRHSPELGGRMLKTSSADNTFDKMFKSGTYLSIAWPTVNALSGKTIRRVALTDYDRFPVDIGGEGAAFDLARRRTNSFKRLGMTYVESSPSFDVSDHRWSPATHHEAPPCEGGILGIYNRGDRRRWYWKCPHCGDYFEPSFALMRWPESEDIMECAEKAYMACPHCFETNGAMIESHMKYDLNIGGVWLRDGETIDKFGNRGGTARRSDIASFWVKGPATAFGQWKTLVINYLLAYQEYESTGNDRPLKTTYNTDQGEPYIPPKLRDARSPEDLMQRACDFGERSVPEEVRFLVATIDVQKHKFVVQVHGIKPANATVDMVVVDRFDIQKSERRDEDNERHLVNPASYPEDWDLITSQVIERTYPLNDGSGRQMAIKLVGCDSGGRAGVTSRAYEYYRRLKTQGLAGRFYLLKGASNKAAPRVQKSFPDSDRKDRNAGARGEIPVLMLNTDILKDWLDAALGREEPGAGYIEFADWLPLDFYKELCAETRNAKGQWENLKKLRNESWDLLAYCYALCVALRAEKINWDKPKQVWACIWNENPLVSAVTTNGIQHKPRDEDDTLTKLRKLAQKVG